MISTRKSVSYPSVATLVSEKAASRIHAKDATLYDFSAEAMECAENFMGWADLAQNPPVAVKKIKKLADSYADAGFKAAVLIGQGGSTQASMTMSKYYKPEKPRMRFYTLDSDSPVRLREVLGKCKLAKTLVIVSSKSGGTLEMRLMLSAVREMYLQEMNEQEFCEHLVAITDPGSPLAQRATDEGWSNILYGEPIVGGRFSALSVFGLFPAALIGIPVKKFVAHAAKMEARCSADTADNPAIQLAAFMYDNYRAGRNKLAYISPKRGRTLGLWIEQLIAESTGKQGQGILPYLEVDTLLLARGAQDRMAVSYETPFATEDAQLGFQKSLSVISDSVPQVQFELPSILAVAEQFVLWEYATALCGYLMRICPFDQPDVASAKACVLDILDTGLPAPDFTEEFLGEIPLGMAKVHLSACCEQEHNIYHALKALLGSLQPGDYFALNAFLPFTGEDRKKALESIRFAVAEKRGVASCLEVGPRFLHSTGQLQKGGPDQGVFLVLSADEADDIALQDQPAASLGALAEAQATGDAQTLAQRGRRCLHLHLPDSYGVTLGYLAALVWEVLDDLEGGR